jgi:hypothetical protein
LIYSGGRINPWDAGSGFFDEPTVTIDLCSSTVKFDGLCSFSVLFDKADFSAVKLAHHNGIDTRLYETLRFYISLTGSGNQNFKVFTTSPRSDCDFGPEPVYPPTYELQPELKKFLPFPSATAVWQKVDISLREIVDPMEPIMNGFAFQNMGGVQELFYLNYISLVSRRSPKLDLKTSKAVYSVGDTVTASVFRVRNPEAKAVPVHLQVWLEVPTIGRVSLINIGSDGRFSLPASIDANAGPISLITISESFPPKGTWELRSQVIDSIKGNLLSECRNFFVVK